MPNSIVHHQFPRTTWRSGIKYLWNPIHRQALKNRPEERIRLRVIEYLMESGWSKHRISTEEGIYSTTEKKLRTDLICYSHEFNPVLLVECKSGEVNVSKKTAEQIARYNRRINAPYLLMTNGKADLWYAFKDDKKPVLQKKIPELFRNSDQSDDKPISYWNERGFAGRKATPKLQKWMADVLNKSLLNIDTDSLYYLSFKKSLYDLDINHYYYIQSFGKQRIALTFVATVYGGTRLIGIFNKKGENRGVLEINLDLLFDDITPNASLYAAEGQQNINIHNYIEWNDAAFHFTKFPGQTKHLFDELIG